MQKEAATKRREPPRDRAARHWLIARSLGGRVEVLGTGLDGGGTILPVFSSGEDAALFLAAEAPGKGYRVGELGPEELLSVLFGPPCANVEKVALDPMPGVPTEVAAVLVGVSLPSFVGRFFSRCALLEEEATAAASIPRSPPKRRLGRAVAAAGGTAWETAGMGWGGLGRPRRASSALDRLTTIEAWATDEKRGLRR